MGIDKVTLRVGENRERVFASVRCTEKEEKTEIATCDLRFATYSTQLVY